MKKTFKPVDGYITSYMGRNRRNPANPNIVANHNGIDIAANANEKTLAWADGYVTDVGYTSVSGNYVIIQHYIDGRYYTTNYSHLNKILVGKGWTVTGGHAIGLAGATGRANGVHCHFELLNKSFFTQNFADRLDPLLYFVDNITMDAQRMLAYLGYNTTVDGYLGDKTIQAITNFQYDVGLYNDGYYGATTESYLRKAYADAKKNKPQPKPKPIEQDVLKDMKLNLTTKIAIMELNNKAVDDGLLTKKIFMKKDEQNIKSVPGWSDKYNDKALENMSDDDLKNKYLTITIRQQL